MNKKVTKTAFGLNREGSLVEKYILSGNGGLTAEIITHGATIQALNFVGKDVVLGYDTVAEYENNGGYIGATIGRFGNRIKNGEFSLNGEKYTLAKNEAGINHLHGGNIGFDRRLFKAEIIEAEIPTLKMRYFSADGEEGFPGNLDFSVTFSISDDNALKLCYEAVSDKETILSTTNHTYFNLNGFDGGDVTNNQLQIFADHVTPTDAELIPTGELLSVAETQLDFREIKAIGADIDNQDGKAGDQIKFGGGYDINYVLGSEHQMRKAVYCYSPTSRIEMECFTDLPGVQFYSGNATAADSGKGNIPLYKRQGFCLETQFFPDAPNKADFPSCVLKKDEKFISQTIYKFTKKV